VSEDWYPSDYYIQPHYDSFPTINLWDQESFTGRRRKYWDSAWTRAIQRWSPVGLNLAYHSGPLECPSPGVTLEVFNSPPGIGAWTQFNEPPACGFIQVDRTLWRNTLRSRNIKYLTEVMNHELGHVLGFGHGGMGIMSYDPNKTPYPNAEEITAARAYWL
jgi:hypothetical protein